MPRVDRAIWGRDRIERARRRWTLVRPPLPAVPHEDAPRTGRAAGEAAATRWCDTANAPGRGPIRGRDRIGRAPALRPLPHPGPYLECPRRTRLRPALGLAGRLQHAGAIPPMPRVGGPSGAEIVLGRAPTVGRPHHPGHTPSAPEGSASDEDQLGGRDGTGESGAAMAFAWAANAISAAGSLRIRWMPRVVGRRWAALTRAGAASWPLVRRWLGSAQTPGAPVARGGLVV